MASQPPVICLCQEVLTIPSRQVRKKPQFLCCQERFCKQKLNNDFAEK
nr:MAG TPA: hypothetical protein [Caudoviricetes sp.]